MTPAQPPQGVHRGLGQRRGEALQIRTRDEIRGREFRGHLEFAEHVDVRREGERVRDGYRVQCECGRGEI